MSAADRRRLVLLVLLAALAGLAGLFTFRGEQAVTLYRVTAYWAYWALALLWLFVGYRVVSGEWRSLVPSGRFEWGELVFVSLVAVWLAWGLQEGGLRIINDDTLQVQTSRQLFLDREAGALSRGHEIGRQFVDFNLLVDKRPALFSWVVSLIHSLSGYRVENTVFVSRTSLVLLSVLLFLIGRQMHQKWGGVLLPLLVLTAPLVAHHANGAGFEVFNLMAIALAWWAASLALHRPTPESVAFAVLSGVVAANARYESVLFLVPTGVAALLAWLKAGRPLIHLGLYLAPLLMVPRLWLQHVFSNNSSWQLESKPEAQGVAFGFRFLYDNIGHTFNFFLSTNTKDGNSIALFIVGGVAAILWLFALRRDWRGLAKGINPGLVHYIFWGGLSLHFLLMLHYFWGQFDDLTTQRLAIPEMLWLAAPIVGVLVHLKVSNRWWIAGVTLAMVHLFAFTAPMLARNDMLKMNRAASTHEAIRRWAKANKKPSQLVVSNYTGRVWLAEEIPAITPEAVRRGREKFKFHWDMGTFAEILIVQRYYYDPEALNWVVEPVEDFGPDFVLEEVWRSRDTPTMQTRVSRLVALRNEYPNFEPKSWTQGEQVRFHRERQKFELEWGKQLP